MRRILNKPRPGIGYPRNGVAALPYSDAIRQSVLDAAAAGATPGELSAQLRQAGYTMADLSSIYTQLANTSPLTPQVIDYLQRENAYLADQISTNYRMWVVIGALGFGYYLWQTQNSRGKR